MPDSCLRLQIEGDLAGLEAGQRALHEFLESAGTSAGGLYHAELAFEELVTNVIKYAYRDRDPSQRLIDITARIGEEIVITVEDDGPPFDPLHTAEPSPLTSVHDARIGGLGIHLLRMTAAKMEYERRSGKNRVCVTIQRT